MQVAAAEALNPLWYDFAKEGKEGDALAPLARYPKAAGWLAKSMAMSNDSITRKLAAMLAGWVQDARHASLLVEMLERERKVFRENPSDANSVGEDIMFAATRWSDSRQSQVRDAGIEVLAGMVRDALEGTPWNSVHWALANLYKATGGKNDIFQRLLAVPDQQLQDQTFFRNAVRSLHGHDKSVLSRFVTLPPTQRPLPPSDPHYSVISSLWKAAEAAELAK